MVVSLRDIDHARGGGAVPAGADLPRLLHGSQGVSAQQQGNHHNQPPPRAPAAGSLACVVGERRSAFELGACLGYPDEPGVLGKVLRLAQVRVRCATPATTLADSLRQIASMVMPSSWFVTPYSRVGQRTLH